VQASAFNNASLTIFVFVFFLTADNVTAIEFDPTGNYLATGDRGGRIVVFRGVKSDPVSVSALYVGCHWPFMLRYHVNRRNRANFPSK
jgi:hypothetical protein